MSKKGILLIVRRIGCPQIRNNSGTTLGNHIGSSFISARKPQFSPRRRDGDSPTNVSIVRVFFPTQATSSAMSGFIRVKDPSPVSLVARRLLIAATDESTRNYTTSRRCRCQFYFDVRLILSVQIELN